MACPFLSKLPTGFFNKYSASLVNAYGSYCPVISSQSNFRSYSSMKDSGECPEQKEGNPSQCPFLESVKPTLTQVNPDDFPNTQEMDQTANMSARDQMKQLTRNKSNFPKNSSGFKFQEFFEDQIMKKKMDHSYRIFKRVARFAENPPFGGDLSQSHPDITVWCSNDYLGMSSHAKVKEAVVDAVKKFGSGSGGTRNISGNSPLHEDLEKELAALHKKDSALLFTSCFVANDSTLFTLGKKIPNVHFFSDAGNHASMIQGIKNSGAPKHIFRTCDPIHLEDLLRSVDSNVPKIVVFETVHSMTGAISPTEALCDVAHKYGAITFVDEVHAVGLYGEEGAGVAQRDQIMDKIDIVSGTMGKAFGNIGGYVASSASCIDMIRSYAAGFIFTTSLPPTVLRGALTSIKILRSQEGKDLRTRHQDNVAFLKAHLTHAGLPQLPSASHIIPVPVGDPQLCAWVCNQLMSDYGHYVQSINYPTVPKGEERLRIAPTPFHTKKMMELFVSDLKKVWTAAGLPLLKDHCSAQSCFYCHRPLPTPKDSRSTSCAQESSEKYPCGNADGCPQLVSMF